MRGSPWRNIVALVALAFIVVAFGYSSALVTSPPGREDLMVECDGSTHVEGEGCRSWGADLISGELNFPPGIEAAEIERLEIEHAAWGYLDRCTVTAFQSGTGFKFEQEVSCRYDS